MRLVILEETVEGGRMACEVQTHTGRIPCDEGGRERTCAGTSREHQPCPLTEAQGGHSIEVPTVSLREHGLPDSIGFLLLASRIVR